MIVFSFKDSRKLSLLCRVGSLCWLHLVWGVALRDPPAHPEVRMGSACGWSLGAWPSGACSSSGSAPGGAAHSETPTPVYFLIRKIFMEEMMMLGA